MPQLFGSGKSFFLSHVIEIISNALHHYKETGQDPLISLLLSVPEKKPQPSSSSTQAPTPTPAGAEDRSTRFANLDYYPREITLTLDQLQEFANAKTMIIDLSTLSAMSASSVSRSFQDALNIEFWHQAKACCPPVQRSSSSANTEAPFAQQLQQITGHNGYWFICFDEVGAVDGDPFVTRFPEFQRMTSDGRYDTVLAYLTGWIKQEGLFGMAAGRSTTMADRALRTVHGGTSPFFLHYLSLGSLCPFPDIQLILDETRWPKELDNVSISQVLFDHAKIGVSKQDLIDAIHAWSGGIPRLVQYIIMGLLRNVTSLHELQSKADLDRFLAPKGPSGQIAPFESIGPLEMVLLDLPNEARESKFISYYGTFLSSHLINQPIPRQISQDGVSVETIDLLNQFGLYAYPAQGGLRLALPKYFVLRLNSGALNDYLPCRSSFIAKMLEQHSALPKLFDQGRITELVVGDRYTGKVEQARAAHPSASKLEYC